MRGSDQAALMALALVSLNSTFLCRDMLNEESIPNGIIEPVKPRRTIHRNDLCPCSSGRKYKRCCRINPKE